MHLKAKIKFTIFSDFTFIRRELTIFMMENLDKNLQMRGRSLMTSRGGGGCKVLGYRFVTGLNDTTFLMTKGGVFGSKIYRICVTSFLKNP